MDGGRLWRRFDGEAEIGAIPGNGVNRQALSDEDIAARELLIAWAHRRGYAVSVDEAANLFIRRDGDEPGLPPVLTGAIWTASPRRPVRRDLRGDCGPRGDGSARDAGATTRRPVELAAWTNEEGSRFDPGCIGSMVFSGAAALERFEDTVDTDGISFGRALARTIAAAPDIPQRGEQAPPAAYVEAHIEQGPVLEAAAVPIGAVTGVQGSQRFVIEIGGATAHAGTTPSAVRRDALQAAVRAVTGLNEAMSDPEDILRFTVGRFEVAPNSPNTVPSEAVFSIDLRHPDGRELNRRAQRIAAVCEDVAHPCRIRVGKTFDQKPVAFEPGIVALIERTAEALRLPALRLPSGAFHDAAMVASLCPTAMIFIPCLHGVSHHESEYASPEDCAAGARVLAGTLYELATAEEQRWTTPTPATSSVTDARPPIPNGRAAPGSRSSLSSTTKRAGRTPCSTATAIRKRS